MLSPQQGPHGKNVSIIPIYRWENRGLKRKSGLLRSDSYQFSPVWLWRPALTPLQSTPLPPQDWGRGAAVIREMMPQPRAGRVAEARREARGSRHGERSHRMIPIITVTWTGRWSAGDLGGGGQGRNDNEQLYGKQPSKGFRHMHRGARLPTQNSALWLVPQFPYLPMRTITEFVWDNVCKELRPAPGLPIVNVSYYMERQGGLWLSLKRKGAGQIQ